MTTTKPRRPTEAQCQATLIAAAKRGGWRVHAERTSLMASGRHATAIQGHAGWPDLALAHPERGFVLIELKRRPNKLQPAQEAWQQVLLAAGVVCMTWWTDDLDAHVAWLVNGPRMPRTCLVCGAGADLTIDHIVPISRGGSDDLSNLQVLCRRCNSSKKDRI